MEKFPRSKQKKMFVGTVLMDLFKAFGSISHDFLIAKIHANGFSKNSPVFLYSYLKDENKMLEQITLKDLY